ncbi:hypothetical protein GYMLUDRAFT_689960 [Collybiopsis luxurians FD-317 M1]|uniref:Uncharacterized protein n=1 Tax=Collybiopsis luxurians FD-317 M1 TaxID=944289 RepID=A0A0D0CK17_9AGAR|nr:hypothetical protein GYMLUDRAFT_689960 [Collybiopsis luxurians FD-317 M1]
MYEGKVQIRILKDVFTHTSNKTVFNLPYGRKLVCRSVDVITPSLLSFFSIFLVPFGLGHLNDRLALWRSSFVDDRSLTAVPPRSIPAVLIQSFRTEAGPRWKTSESKFLQRSAREKVPVLSQQQLIINTYVADSEIQL